MRDSELQIDRSCHVLYSKPCKKEIQAKIALHYPEAEREAVWEQVQRQYVDFLSDWRTDLGGKRNFHNGAGGTYDCIAIMCFYDVCRDVVTFREMEEIEENLILPSFRKLRFVDINKPFWKKLMYRAFSTAQKHCDTWHDYEMDVAPYENSKPIYYEFTTCPAAEFAKRFGFADIMPALCNVDYASMELYLYRAWFHCRERRRHGRTRARVAGKDFGAGEGGGRKVRGAAAMAGGALPVNGRQLCLPPSGGRWPRRAG